MRNVSIKLKQQCYRALPGTSFCDCYCYWVIISGYKLMDLQRFNDPCSICGKADYILMRNIRVVTAIELKNYFKKVFM